MAAGYKTGGRKPGTPNKSTAAIKALAQEHAETVIVELARLAIESESDAARVAAIKELLDRGFGKSPQAIVGDDDAPPVNLRTRIEIVVVDPIDSKG